jgi:hypothetical protein
VDGTGRTEAAGEASRFAADPVAAVVELLRQAGKPRGAVAIKDGLVAAGVARDAADRVWPGVQRALTKHPNVVITGRSYRWRAGPVIKEQPLTGRDERTTALELQARELAQRCVELTQRCTDLEVVIKAGRAGVREAEERQARIDLIRGLAELAMEVEELAYSGAEPEILIERIRALVDAYELEPIGRAGEEEPFDPARHAPIGGLVGDGSRISVVRPGYTWRAPDGDVLIGKAQVTPL